MKINGKKVIGKYFAYDGCHKIYILENDKQKREAYIDKWEIYPIEMIIEIFTQSCPLRFISNYKLTKYYVKQFEKAVVEYYE